MRKTCTACGVQMEGDVVYFSFPPNKPQTKARLRARVCQYAKKDGCINDFTEIVESECWRPL